MKHFIPLLLSVLLFASACNNKQHFISDKAYRTEVNALFEQRKTELAVRGNELFGVFERTEIPEEQKEALEFLYAYMSLNDLADYDGDFFYRQTQTAFEARNFFAWGKTVPEDLFRHFVLPVRVNNENLDTARQVIFHELKDRMQGKTMYQAALEVNRWCHEKVTYRGSCSRTSAPLATMLSGYGRCGEESTFTTAALRAVGIPARQCYTPRWAHTDDNHAWVEVWVDGKWYFLGACEPDTELNKAWFTAPAKRAMMVHTNVFGKYLGIESKTDYPLYTKINTLENYTTVKKLEVTVLDTDNKPIEGAAPYKRKKQAGNRQGNTGVANQAGQENAKIAPPLKPHNSFPVHHQKQRYGNARGQQQGRHPGGNIHRAEGGRLGLYRVSLGFGQIHHRLKRRQ